ncbi:hypothetical protein GCM10027169_16890 [Gordonia jinhuaensis]|uniref:DUF1023 domain-containing protein n=1 Tax=Gordonia jinhuaensis TaxID=1517702 RepID=A0A916X1S9_9ACTN|nr:hypothetical protein GCM10011489_38810 [Gordonia jinhuaensis]
MIDYAAALQASNSTFTDQVHQMDRAVDTAMGKWQGDAAAAASARGLSEKLAASHIDTAVVAIAEAHASRGAGLNGMRTALLAIVDQEAPGAGMSVADDGTVTAPKVPGGDGNVLAMLMQIQLDGQAKAMEARIKALLTQFGDGENQAAQAIQAAQAQLEAVENSSGSATVSAAVQDIVSGKSQLPTDPKQLHEMWSKLSPADKDALFAHDNYIGNRDGMPVSDRDHYNRIKLGDELARAQAGDPAVAGRIDDLKAVKDTIGKDPNRMLMLLDTQSGTQTHAAVAVGNPDTANHVAVTTPGLNTTVGGAMKDMTDEGALMKYTSEAQLDKTPGLKGEKGVDGFVDRVRRAAVGSRRDCLGEESGRWNQGVRAVERPSCGTAPGQLLRGHRRLARRRRPASDRGGALVRVVHDGARTTTDPGGRCRRHDRLRLTRAGHRARPRLQPARQAAHPTRPRLRDDRAQRSRRAHEPLRLEPGLHVRIHPPRHRCDCDARRSAARGCDRSQRVPESR